MSAALGPWPGLREQMQDARDQLDRELAFLRGELFDTHQPRSAQTLTGFESRVSQTIAKIDRSVGGLRAEVDERLRGLEERIPIVRERLESLAEAKRNLELGGGIHAISTHAAAAITLIVFAATALLGRESLGLSVARSIIIGIVVVVVGGGAAYAAHTLISDTSFGRGVGSIASLAIGAAGALIIEADAGDGPSWRRIVLVVVAAAASLAVFGVIFGFITTGDERRRRRLLIEAVNGTSAAEQELRRVIPAEQQLLKAAQVALDELGSNNCRIARDYFVNRSARLLEDTPAKRRHELEQEFSRMRHLLDQKIRAHLGTSGEPEAWPTLESV